MTDFFTNAGIIAKLTIFIVFAPLVMGVLYAIKPSERKLAFMRPLSLAAIFAALSGTCLGVINVLMGATEHPQGVSSAHALLGLAETLVALFVGFGCQTVAWLCVAIGMRR
jgi:hypothetical protein